MTLSDLFVQLDSSSWQQHIAHALEAASERQITPSLRPLASLLKSVSPIEEEQYAQQAEALVDAVPTGEQCCDCCSSMSQRLPGLLIMHYSTSSSFPPFVLSQVGHS